MPSRHRRSRGAGRRKMRIRRARTPCAYPARFWCPLYGRYADVFTNLPVESGSYAPAVESEVLPPCFLPLILKKGQVAIRTGLPLKKKTPQIPLKGAVARNDVC